MGKTNKQKKQERKEYIQTIQVLKYMKCLGPDDMVQWSERLEKIEIAKTEEEKEKETKNLQMWLALKYVSANRSLCLDCANKATCKRNQEKVKSCKLFVQKGSDDDENI